MSKKLFIFLFTLFSLNVNATDFYVSSSGNDSNSGTDATSPWQSISKVNSNIFTSGDRILFKRGDSWYGKTLSNKYSGITFGAYGSGENPLIDGNTGYAMTSFLSRKEVVVDGLSFKMSGKSGYIVWFDSSYNFNIKNCKFFGGLVLRGTYNFFENNIVDGATNNGDGNGVWEAFETSHHNTYRGNTVSNFSYRGFWTMTKTHHSLFENNTIHDIGNCGIDLDGAYSLSYCHIVTNNTLYNIDNTSIEIENGFNNTVTNNYMYNGGRSYVFIINYSKGTIQDSLGALNCIGAITNNLITNNVMIGGGHESTKGGVIMAMGVQSAGGVNFYNNSVYDFSGYYFCTLGNNSTEVPGIKVVNNIFFNATKTNGHLVYLAQSDYYNVLEEDDYNLFFDLINPSVYYFNNNRQTLSGYQSSSGKASHSLYANPLFVSTSDLHLTAGSPAIGAGKTFDALLAARTDIGAYPYEQVLSIDPPVTDTVIIKTQKIKTLSVKIIVKNDISIEIKSQRIQNLIITLCDVTGRVISTTQANLRQGSNYISIPKPAATGVYIINFTTYFESLTKKVVIN